jgi:TonB family protein
MSLTTQKEQVETNNRRLYSRGTMRVVTLVFFGPGKWGKLINISEGGMAFEFYQHPPSGQRISFGLEAMGREPSEASGKLAGGSIHADGQLVWARDFERCAGVQFVDISGGTRQQIRQWLSIEPSSKPSSAEGETGQRDAIEVEETEPPGPPLTPDDTTSQGTDVGQIGNAELAQSISPEEPEVTEEPALEKPAGAKYQLHRAALVSMARWLAVLAMIGGITAIILAQRVPLAALFGSIRERSIVNSAPSRAGERSVAKNSLVFQIEAVDVNNRRRLLTFDNNAPAVEARLSFGKAASSTPNKAFLVEPAAPPAQRTTAEKRRSLSNLKLGTPRVTRPATNASTENSTLAIDSVVPGRGVIRAGDTSGLLANTVQVPAAPQTIPVGGQVQQARLISSVPPVYPAIARSIGLQGEVTIDALIDSTGRLAAMKPLSGPIALQQAAMDALRQWSYEPARLDGQPVSTHLSVTVRFRLN